MNVIQQLFAEILGGFVRLVVGECPVDKITRNQEVMSNVIAATTKTISQTIDAELDAVRHVVQVGFGRIEDLLGTTAIAGTQRTALTIASASIAKSLQTLDAQLP